MNNLTSYINVANYIYSKYINNDFENCSNFTDSDKEVVSIIYAVLSLNKDPLQSVPATLIYKFNILTGFDFSYKDAVSYIGNIIFNKNQTESSNDQNQNNGVQLSLFEEDEPNLPSNNINTGKHIMNDRNYCCKHYSYGQNVSSNYEYANHVEIPFCSNSSVASNHCVFILSQTRCPLYSQDSEKIMDINTQDNTSSYTVYRSRTRAIVAPFGFINFDIYNSDDVLVNSLSYPVDVINKISFEDIKTEMINIVEEFHSKITDTKDFSLINILSDDKNISSVSDSYILSLVS